VVAGWQRGDLLGLRLGGLTIEEALALERPAMTYGRARPAIGSAASSPGPSCGGGTLQRPSAGDRILQPGCPQCLRWTLAVRTPAAVPEAAADSGHCRGVQFRSQPDTARGCSVRGGQRPWRPALRTAGMAAG